MIIKSRQFSNLGMTWKYDIQVREQYFIYCVFEKCVLVRAFKSSQPEVFCKKVFIKIRKIHRETPVPESQKACNFIKKGNLAQVFSCEFYKISKNTFFYRTPLVAASELFPFQIESVYIIQSREILPQIFRCL